MNQIEYFGENSLKKIKDIINNFLPKKILLITSNSVYLSKQKEINLLFDNQKIIHFSKIPSNPSLNIIEKIINDTKNEGIDLIISIGGGSVLDVSKTISLLIKQENNPKSYILKKNKPEHKNVPVIAVPTTVGTGSEATSFSVIYINRIKYSFENPLLLPKYVILDPNLVYSLPSKICAISGADALTQAIESYWSINSNKLSKKYAEKAIKISIKYLPYCVSSSKSALKKMQVAANFSGKAINISKTTACHALSYVLTSKFKILHGQAVSISLPTILEYNYNISEKNCSDSRGAEYVKNTMKELLNILEVENVPHAKEKIIKLFKEINLKTSLEELNISDKKLIQNNINLERLKNNPRRINKEELKEIIDSL